jgi:hypothetical protein
VRASLLRQAFAKGARNHVAYRLIVGTLVVGAAFHLGCDEAGSANWLVDFDQLL